MLRNCYQTSYGLPTYFLYVVLLLLGVTSTEGLAKTQNYRLLLTETPATSMLLGWEMIGGCPDTQIVYYDTIDHGQDTAAYAMKATITASNFHQGMENYFCYLAQLQPDRRYYFIIGEDEGISPILYFYTLPIKLITWDAQWIVHAQTTVMNQTLEEYGSQESPDFFLLDGLHQLAEEDEWRKWLKQWQSTIIDGRIFPIVLGGSISVDMYYLFNQNSEEVRQYQLRESSILIIAEEKAKLKKRYWKSISQNSLLILHQHKISKKSSNQADFVLTIGEESNASVPPNVFAWPTKENTIGLKREDHKIVVSSSDGEILREQFIN